VEVDAIVRSLTVKKGSTSQEVFRALDLPPDSFIVLRQGKPIPLNERINEGEVLKLVRVASGG